MFIPLDDFKCQIKEEVTITSGEWEVLARHGSKVRIMASNAITVFEQLLGKLLSYFRLCSCFSFSLSLFLDLGKRRDEVGVLPRHQRHAAGTSFIRSKLRISRRHCPPDQVRLLTQLFCQPGKFNYRRNIHSANIEFCNQHAKVLNP